MKGKIFRQKDCVCGGTNTLERRRGEGGGDTTRDEMLPFEKGGVWGKKEGWTETLPGGRGRDFHIELKTSGKRKGVHKSYVETNDT